MEYNIYRLKGGLKPVNWQLPLNNVFVKKFVEENGKRKDLGYRKITYVEGADTIFKEDIKGDLQPTRIWFQVGELRVLKGDILKNELLQQHPWFDTKYELWSQDLEDKENLAKQRLKSEARRLIDDADFDKIKAIALAVFGPHAINWTDDKCELKLREEADNDPKGLKENMAEKTYESKELAALAFIKGIVKENQGKTAVVWTDSEGVIVKLAKGENGIQELGRFLSVVNDDSKKVLQSIGQRLEAMVTHTASDEETEKDKRIAALEAQLAEAKAKAKPVTAEKKSTASAELQEARKAYKTKFKKDVPANMKNNLLWLQNRLEEK